MIQYNFMNSSLPLFLGIIFILFSCENKVEKSAKNLNNISENGQVLANNAQKDNDIKQENQFPQIDTPTTETVEEFYKAIFDKDAKKVELMLETEYPASFAPKNKIPPLQAVIWTFDYVQLVKLLVEGGADIHNKDFSPVLTASEYGRLEILKYLIEIGCDIKNNEAFNKAGFYQFYEGAKLLLKKGANQELGDVRGKIWVFEKAVIKSDYEVLDLLNLSKDELNYSNCNGETALIIAVKQNNLKMVKYLIGKNVDKNKPETFDCGDDISFGKTALELAKEHKFTDIIPLLE